MISFIYGCGVYPNVFRWENISAMHKPRNAARCEKEQ